MVTNSSNPKSKSRKKPEFVIAEFSLYKHPRFKNGAFSGFIGWSKPIIEIQLFELLYVDQPVRFGREFVRVVDWSRDSIVLQFDKSIEHTHDEEEGETRVVRFNEPIKTGYEPNMCDASCSYYFGCWTSWRSFLKYYLGVKWVRWVDDRRIQIITLPSRYTATAIKRRWKMRWQWFNRKIDEIFDLDRPIKWK